MTDLGRDELFAMLALPLASGLLGLAIGAGQQRMWQAMLLCGFSGSAIGMIMIGALIVPAPPIQAGCAVLLPIVTTLLIRVRSY